VKIAPQQIGFPAPSPLGPAAGEPLQPFADFLATATPAPSHRPPERAFGFAELSLFGIAHAIDAADPRAPQGAGQDRAAASPAHVQAPTAARLPNAPSPNSLSGRISAATGESPAHLPVRNAASRARTSAPAANEAASAPIMEAAADGAQADAPVDAARAAARTLRQAQRPAGSLSLIFVEADGRLHIVAGAPHLDDRSRAELRRSAEALAAEFGFSLSRLTLNGEALQPPPPIFRRL
jgi:hypothetical protein